MIPAILVAITTILLLVFFSTRAGSGNELESLPTVQQSEDFFGKVDIICAQLGIEPGWLLACMDFESGLNPARINSQSGATGLIQFLPGTAANLGTTTDDLASMDAASQLDYVYQYFSPFTGRMHNLGDVYMAILWPSAVGKLDSLILFKSGTIEYDQNAGLDINNKGYVTRGDAAGVVNRIYLAKYTKPVQGTNA